MADKDKYVNIADLKAKLRYWCKSRGASKQVNESLMETVKRIPYTVRADISETLECESENGWIPCSERLPEENEPVLCYLRTGDFLIMELDGAWFDGIHRYSLHSVTHWMPLPEPPREERA